MKDKLEVGMYVRTKDGIIDKVIIDYNGHCADPNCEYKHISCAKNYYDEDKIVKASYNIIDLIEVGDYVNGEKVLLKNEGYIKVGTGRDYIVVNNEKFIKSIVTKEQFSTMEYKLGGKDEIK